MSLIVSCIAVCVAFIFAYKYFRQKAAIRLLVDSLVSRTSILTHTQEFRGTDESWGRLIRELNRLLEELGQLSRQSSGQLNQIETTLGSLQEGVVIVDRDNYIRLVNNALRDLFPAMGQKVGQRIESGMRSPEFLDFVWDFKKGEGTSKKEIQFSSGQSEVWLEVTGARLSESLEGKGPWFLFVLHDITKQKLLERARKLFVANASHELKTPVSVIKGYAETLVTDHETMPGEDRDRFLKTIHRHAERLALLINDLLSLSRLESDAPSFDWTEGDVLQWIRDIVSDYRSNPRRPGLRVELDFAAEMEARVKFDVLKLRQVFDNLVENASKYSPEAGRISFGVEKREGRVILTVKDQGPGVPEGELARIFERFHRVDKGRSRETGGTGLGLSIVKHIVEWHGGRVWAENAEDGGLRVSFSLPLLAAPAAAPAGEKSD